MYNDQPVHLIIRVKEGKNLSDILRDYKKFTSKTIMKAIKQNIQESRKEWLLERFTTTDGYRFWRADNKPIELWSNRIIEQKINYVHQNPVKEGTVFRAEDYVYSSAIDYAGEKGLLDVIVIKYRHRLQSTLIKNCTDISTARITNPRQQRSSEVFLYSGQSFKNKSI